MAQRQPVVDPRLVVGGIYIMVFLRDTPENLYWALYHHLTESSGTKYHIKGIGVAWIADHGTTSGVMRSMYLIGVMRIGYCAPQDYHKVDTIVRSVPTDQAPPGYNSLTCRTWALHVVRLLGSGSNDYVRCNDINALEQEVTKWGAENYNSAYVNEQPRPVENSKVCQLD